MERHNSTAEKNIVIQIKYAKRGKSSTWHLGLLHNHSTVGDSHDRYWLHTDSSSEHDGCTELCKQSAHGPSGASHNRAQFTVGTSTSASCSHNYTQRSSKFPTNRFSSTITTTFPTVIAPTRFSYPPTTPRSPSCETREGRPLRKLCSRRRNYPQRLLAAVR
jgi:hypothetical protein